VRSLVLYRSAPQNSIHEKHIQSPSTIYVDSMKRKFQISQLCNASSYHNFFSIFLFRCKKNEYYIK